ncbi:hypothetical protein MOMUL_30730 [Moorella mulderi DSM 14980]|uniref:Uncharacterized protein n=1 Tax=Moorella mulderi DSM 14980 TaxID=1122241 RepID=A0A151AS87_9FIRM|nr:hypothetical protein MOMUL_30730 [Moorella mulderi DSM 14980]
MLNHFHLGRDDLEFLPHLGAHFMQRAAAARADPFFFRQAVLYYFYRQIFQVHLPAAAPFAALVGDGFQIRLRCLRPGFHFRLIKKQELLL